MTLEEWADELWRKGDSVTSQYAREIQELLAETERLERLDELEDELGYHARAHDVEFKKPLDAIEWLGAQAELVAECERRLEKYGFTSDADLDDKVDDNAAALADIADTLEKLGGYEVTAETDLDSLVMGLCERAKDSKQYDL